MRSSKSSTASHDREAWASKPPSDGSCPVCEGAGYWDEMTGAPVSSKPPPAGTRKCVYCLGTGKANVPQEGTFR